MDVSQYVGQSDITYGHTLKLRDSAFIAVLQFIVTIVSSIMSITRAIK